MARDFGAGLSVDELIGLSAWFIYHLALPDEEVFKTTMAAAMQLVKADLGSLILLELWEDGHTVWMSPDTKRPVVVTPAGQMIPSKL
ncbi:MAG: hypothetical protein U9R53_07300 [Chloroflexota bacterium]|nr:hypothetical protein [Chloroflexota bacterium]